MAINYTEQLAEEIKHIPREHLPALFNIVHSFRESVSLKDEMLDKAYCREAIGEALAVSEPTESFDRESWLENTKEQLKKSAPGEE